MTRDEYACPHHRSPAEIRRDIADYYESVTRLDHGVGLELGQVVGGDPHIGQLVLDRQRFERGGGRPVPEVLHGVEGQYRAIHRLGNRLRLQRGPRGRRGRCDGRSPRAAAARRS